MSGPLPLTPRQEKVWRYIRSCERSPTYEEIAEALGTKSKGNISLVVVSLKKRGYVTYIPGVARSLIALDPNLDLSGIPTSTLAAELARRLAS